MQDETARTARLMKVAEAAVEEFDRQGVAEAMANLRFDPWHWRERSSRQRTAMSFTSAAAAIDDDYRGAAELKIPANGVI
jgi:hypothetical protein